MGLFTRKKKSKEGHVYIAESTRKDGSKKLYVGQTGRTPRTRMSEHISSVKSSSNSSWVSKGKNVRLLGSVKTSNRYTAERTIKSMSPASKRKLASVGAKRYKKRRN